LGYIGQPQVADSWKTQSIECEEDSEDTDLPLKNLLRRVNAEEEDSEEENDTDFAREMMYLIKSLGHPSIDTEGMTVKHLKFLVRLALLMASTERNDQVDE